MSYENENMFFLSKGIESDKLSGDVQIFWVIPYLKSSGFNLTSRDYWFIARFWIFTTQLFVKKIKIIGIISGSVRFKLCVDSVIFLVYINSFDIVHNQANSFKKSYCQIFEKPDQTDYIIWVMHLI